MSGLLFEAREAPEPCRQFGSELTRDQVQSISTILLLIRHAHSAGNESGPGVPMSGWTDLPLSEHGQEEARTIAAYIARTARPIAVYSSPLQRARCTAQPLACASGARLLLEPDLREINCGSADGLPMATVQACFAREWARNESEDDPDFRWPGGESYRELRARVWSALGRIAAHHPAGRVALVTHAGVITQILGEIAGDSAARWRTRRPRNASLTTIEWSPTQARVLGFDVVAP